LVFSLLYFFNVVSELQKREALDRDKRALAFELQQSEDRIVSLSLQVKRLQHCRKKSANRGREAITPGSGSSKISPEQKITQVKQFIGSQPKKHLLSNSFANAPPSSAANAVGSVSPSDMASVRSTESPIASTLNKLCFSFEGAENIPVCGPVASPLKKRSKLYSSCSPTQPKSAEGIVTNRAKSSRSAKSRVLALLEGRGGGESPSESNWM
jgi:hypothetical protein